MTQPIYDSRQGFLKEIIFVLIIIEIISHSIPGGFRVFIGNLGARTNISELQHECERYGPLVDCWVAR